MSLPPLCMLYGRQERQSSTQENESLVRDVFGWEELHGNGDLDSILTFVDRLQRVIEPNPCYISGFRLAFPLEALPSCLFSILESSSIPFRSSTHLGHMLGHFSQVVLSVDDAVLFLLNLACFCLLCAEW